MKPIELNIRDCGLCDYEAMHEEQRRLLSLVAGGQLCSTVLLLEHSSVITLGARESENKLISSAANLEAKGISLVPTRRGGGATAHNPGQLVIYPIIDLRRLDIDINRYIRELEQVGIDALATIGIEAGRKKGAPGLWVGGEKIASIGVRVSMGITYHGIAINLCNDLSIFQYIIPCGIDGVVMSSAEKLGVSCDMEAFKRITTSIIVEKFSSEELVSYG